MSVLHRNEDGQVDLTGGKISFRSGKYEAIRRNQMYLRLIAGESLTGPDRGLDYFNFLFRDNITLAQAGAYIRTRILAIPGNLSISEFHLIQDGRILKLRYSVKTSLTDSEINISEDLRGPDEIRRN